MNAPSRNGDFEAFLGAFADVVADRVAAKLQAGAPGWVDQSSSPLRRRHNAAVRRRLAAGLGGASIVGRRHLLSPAALEDELARVSGMPKAKAAVAGSVADELRAELAGLRVVR